MLRPSRPMIRPFSSSDFSSTTDTVVSTAWLDATRCITAARMLRARRSASWRVSSSTCLMMRALSWRSSSSSSRIMICFACPALRPDTRSSSRSCRAFSVFSSSRVWSRLRRRSSSERSRSSSSCVCSSSELSFARSRSSSRAISVRRASSSSSSAVAPSGRARLPRPAQARAPASRRLPAGPAWTVRGRCTSITTANRDSRRDQRRQHDLHLRLLAPAREAGPGVSTLSSLSGAARGRETRHRLGARHAPRTGARRAASRDPPERSSRAGRSRWSESSSGEA